MFVAGGLGAAGQIQVHEGRKSYLWNESSDLPCRSLGYACIHIPHRWQPEIPCFLGNLVIFIVELSFPGKDYQGT